MALQGIFREPTSRERKDMIILDNKRDPRVETVNLMLSKFSRENRKLLALSEDPTKEDPSCHSCWELEFGKGMNNDNFETEYKAYQGRLKLVDVKKSKSDKIVVPGVKGRVSQSYAYAIKFQCVYCAHTYIFTFAEDSEADNSLLEKSKGAMKAYLQEEHGY